MSAHEASRRLPVDRSRWAAGVQRRRRRHRERSIPARIAFAVAGVVVLLVGIVAIPLPGPGWAIVFVGLGMLAMEFAWAERLALLVLGGLQWFWERWLDAPRWQRAVLLVLLFAITTFALLLSATLVGAPEFVPKLW